MKVLYNWLKEFVPLEISAEETAATLARLGFEIAQVQTFGGQLSGVVTAEVRECAKHPNADRLSLCKVWDGQTEYSVVCGAPNVKAGQKVAFARAGATLPDGEILRAAKIRGTDSQGMICSAEELGLPKTLDGILELPADTSLGMDVRPLLDLNDAMIEIEITPNRRDALGILGVARELAAGLNLPLKNLEPRSRELDLATTTVSVTNEAQDLCPRYTARYIRDVKVGPSPNWMVRRLVRCGYRPINNVVDITNYVMHELGQPMHAFDAVKLEGRQIRIRRAKTGETLATLEGKTATLEEGMLVIADDARPIALAGVIGGELSAISSESAEIVIESAAFAPSQVRMTSKKLGIKSESSYRFERGSDYDMVLFASRRAAQLIQELAGGLCTKPIEASAPPPPALMIKLRTDRIKQYLGLDMKESMAADLLRKLGCVISIGTGQLHVTVPTWRLDLTMEVDLLEEIARLYGYDQIPARNPAIRLTTVPEDRVWAFERQIATLLSGLGYSETCSTSFVNSQQAEAFTPPLGEKQDSKPVLIANPLSQEQTALRTSLLPALLQNALLNFHRQNPGVQFFENGRIFYQNHEGRHESRRIALLAGGDVRAAHWRQKKKKADYYDVSGVVEALLKALHISNYQAMPSRAAAFHPKRCCNLLVGSKSLGWVGEIHPDLMQDLDTTEPLIAAELDTQALLEATSHQVPYAPPSPFPPVRRDLSLIAPENCPSEKIAKTLRSAGGKDLESLSLIDLYLGDKIGPGKKSLTVSLVFRNKEKTLSDADVDKLFQKMVGDLEKKCEATLRK
jgi:phenylalanyl-tRNA synthetase beta chain